MEDQKDQVIEKTKAEKFADSPDEFYHIEDLSMAITKPTEDGQRQVLVNTGSAMEMGGLIFLLQRHCQRMLDLIQMQKAQDKQAVSSLINGANKKNFRNFIRRA